MTEKTPERKAAQAAYLLLLHIAAGRENEGLQGMTTQPQNTLLQYMNTGVTNVGYAERKKPRQRDCRQTTLNHWQGVVLICHATLDQFASHVIVGRGINGRMC